MERSSIWEEAVPVRIIPEGRDERSADLTVTLYELSEQGHMSAIRLQITHEMDSSLMYTCDVTESSFGAMKAAMQLHVEFHTFAENIVTYLNTVRTGGLLPHYKDARLECRLLMKDGSEASFKIVELNSFRDVVHLDFPLVAGNDGSRASHLAERLTMTKAALRQCQEQLAQTIEQSNDKINSLESHIQQLNGACDELKGKCMQGDADLKSAIAEASSRHSEAMDAARQQYARELRQKEQQFEARNRELENGISQLTEELKTISQTKSDVEVELKATQTKLRASEASDKAAQSDAGMLRSKLSRIEEQLAQAGSDGRTSEVELARLTQAVADKDEQIKLLTDRVDGLNETKRAMEKELSNTRSSVGKLEDKLAQASSEIHKGNHIIEKLDGELRGSKQRSKQRSEAVKVLEKRLADKDGELARLADTLSSERSRLTDRDSSIKRLESELKRAQDKAEEQDKALKSNQEVIQWLNDQLNETSLNVRPRPARVGMSTNISTTSATVPSSLRASNSTVATHMAHNITRGSETSAASILRSALDSVSLDSSMAKGQSHVPPLAHEQENVASNSLNGGYIDPLAQAHKALSSTLSPVKGGLPGSNATPAALRTALRTVVYKPPPAPAGDLSAAGTVAMQ